MAATTHVSMVEPVLTTVGSTAGVLAGAAGDTEHGISSTVFGHRMIVANISSLPTASTPPTGSRISNIMTFASNSRDPSNDSSATTSARSDLDDYASSRGAVTTFGHGDMLTRLSLLLVMCQTTLMVTNIVIVVPTVDEYAGKLGAGSVFSGLVISLTPFWAVLGIILNYWMLKVTDFKTVLYIMMAGCVVGNTLYALGGLTRSKYALLIARSLIGLCSGQSFAPNYVSRTVSLERRSQVMFSFQASAVVGYVVGPLMAWALETFCKELRIENLVLDSDTAPGWLMAVLFFVFMLMVSLVFVNPPAGESSLNHPLREGPQQHGLGPARAFCMLITMWAMMTATVSSAMIEVYAAKVAKTVWGWNVQTTSIYLVCIMTLVIPACLFAGRASQFVEDRKGLLVGSMIAAGCSVLLMDWSFHSTAAQVSIFSLGLLFVLSFSAITRGLIFSVNTKLVPAQMKPKANLVTSSALCFGRGIGSLLGVLIEPGSFGFFQMGIYVTIAVLVTIGYKNLKPHEHAC